MQTAVSIRAAKAHSDSRALLRHHEHLMVQYEALMSYRDDLLADLGELVSVSRYKLAQRESIWRAK